jgi:peptide/nickel transport system permease protein
LIRFLTQRPAGSAVVLRLVLLLTFALVGFVPGDPTTVLPEASATPEHVERLRAQPRLNMLLPLQILDWYRRILSGDLSQSILLNRSVTEALLERLPVTMSIAAIALTLAVLLSRRGEEILDPLFHNRWPDQIMMSTALFSWSVPDFWLGPAFAVVFALGLGWFPTGDCTSIEQGVTERARSIALPSLALVLTQMGFVACVARDSMPDVLN